MLQIVVMHDLRGVRDVIHKRARVYSMLKISAAETLMIETFGFIVEIYIVSRLNDLFVILREGLNSFDEFAEFYVHNTRDIDCFSCVFTAETAKEFNLTKDLSFLCWKKLY